MFAAICSISVFPIVVRGDDGLFVRANRGTNSKAFEAGHIVYKIPARKAGISKIWLRKDTEWEKTRDYWLFIEFDSHPPLDPKSESQPAAPGDGFLIILDGDKVQDLEFKYRGAEANVTRWAARLADVDNGARIAFALR